MSKITFIVLGSMFVAAGCGGYLIGQSKAGDNIPTETTSPVLAKDRKITGAEIDFILQDQDIRDKNIIDTLLSIKKKIEDKKHITVSRDQGILLLTNILVDEMEGGLHIRAYDDGAGVMTIGYGSTFIQDKGGKTRRVRRGDIISKSEAVKLRVKSVKENYVFLLKNVPSAVLDKMSVYSIAALNSYIYNIGQTAFLKSEVLSALRKNMRVDSSLLKTFKSSYITAAGKPMNGLIKRRRVESKLLSLSINIKKMEFGRYLAMESFGR